jgi:D-3-phosphoglycerate dehydrogenase
MARHTIDADAAVRNGNWSDYTRFMGTELAGKTLGIVGMGNIGTRVALRARAFEMDIVVYDPYIPEGRVTALGGRWLTLDEVMAESDIVTVHCPLNAETDGMIGEQQLALMKPSAYLINAARGGIVNEAALLRTMQSKSIAGAALDVVRDEPPRPDHPLLSLPNVIFTPHLGAVTIEASTRGEWGAAEEAVRVLEGRPPKNPVISFE